LGHGANADLHGDLKNKCQHTAKRPTWKSRAFIGPGKSLLMQYLHSLSASYVPVHSTELDLKKNIFASFGENDRFPKQLQVRKGGFCKP